MRVSHVPKHTRIARKSRKTHADMVVNLEHLALVRRQLTGRALQGHQDGMRL